MKVYGFDDVDVHRGELRAAEAEPWGLRFPGELQARLDWEFMSTRFSEARTELVLRMEQQDVDPELIEGVRRLKAGWLPVEEA
ncbi:hypothetical protein [Marinobacter subterrani]|uniref:Uncharacterized protein n=1 Tax=Marinobacter subterrani TaxID=1658765 RepID=A0A0J7JB04_9GAMM|nr:hypothetical protein [Marinobacter subterrani]KMQ73765.1 hypothetical protein Msub_20986 [Marinobacter subterrani]KMQ75352.1 hypothetical protein Msub_11554 [Marinobacter subterrani]KMQ76994.1 hypothetical protein Msub_13209 [Marinobacter subterrani]